MSDDPGGVDARLECLSRSIAQTNSRLRLVFVFVGVLYVLVLTLVIWVAVVGSASHPGDTSQVWPPEDPEDAVSGSSAIAYAEPRIGGQVVSYRLTRFLLVVPGVHLYYAAGDTVREEARLDNMHYPDTVVVFFRGNPATPMGSCGVYLDRISGFGDLPLAAFEKMVEARRRSLQDSVKERPVQGIDPREPVIDGRIEAAGPVQGRGPASDRGRETGDAEGAAPAHERQ